MTLLSTITNDAINDNLKQRFFNQEIYVSGSHRLDDTGADTLSRHISPMCSSPSTLFEVGRAHSPLLAEDDHLLMCRPRHLHRGDAAVVPRQEPARDASPRLRHCRVGLLQDDHREGEPMRDHLWRVRCGEDRGGEADHAVHRCRLWRGRRRRRH